MIFPKRILGGNIKQAWPYERVENRAINEEKTGSVFADTAGFVLAFRAGRNGREIPQIVIFAAVGDGFQIFGVSAVGDADTGDLALLCHVYRLLLFYNGIIGKLIPGDSACLFYQTDDSFCVGIRLRDLIQCVLYKIVFFHVHASFALVFYAGVSLYARKENEAHSHVPQVLKFISFRSNHEFW